MNITVNSTAFAQELRLINQVAPTKAAIPILVNVLLRAEQHLYMYATDLEVGFSTACRAQIDTQGMCALPAKRLLDLVEQLPDTSVQIYSDGRQARVSAGTFQSRLQLQDANDFPLPQQPPPDGSTTLSATALQTLVKRTRYAISDKGSFAVKGALMTMAEKTSAMVSTDGKRLSIATATHNGEVMPRIILPTKALDALGGLFGGGDITFKQNEKHLFFISGHRMMLSRTVEGQFPNYVRIIPKNSPNNVAIGKVALMAALRRVKMVSGDDQIVVLDFEPKFEDKPSRLLVSSRSFEIGEAQEELVIEYEGEPVKLTLSGEFLLDFLDVAEGSSVTLSFKDSQTPLLVSDGQQFINVIMLVRA